MPALSMCTRISKPVCRLLRGGLSSLSMSGKIREVGYGQVQSAIKDKLHKALKPSYMQIINESYMHNVPEGSETHFKVVIVSEVFEGQPLIKRQRLVMDALKEQLNSGVHALSIQAKTPKQWEESSNVTASPPCLGGSQR